MTAPTVSVLIPAYRAAHTIGRALDSVLNQTKPSFEIVIVDDGSPDDLAPALAPYGDRVRLLRKTNGGAASARNFGIDHCNGEYIAFLDADDYWEPHKLERQLQVFQRWPEVGLVSSRFYEQTPGQPRRPSAASLPPVFDRMVKATGAEIFTAARYIAVPAAMVRRDRLGAHRFDVGLKTAEDLDLWVRLVIAGPVYLSSEPLLTAVLEPGSLSRSSAADDCRNFLTVVHRYAGLLGPVGVRYWEADAYRQLAAAGLGRGDARAAIGPAWNRWLRQPFSPQACWILCKSAALSYRRWRPSMMHPTGPRGLSVP